MRAHVHTRTVFCPVSKAQSTKSRAQSALVLPKSAQLIQETYSLSKLTESSAKTQKIDWNVPKNKCWAPQSTETRSHRRKKHIQSTPVSQKNTWNRSKKHPKTRNTFTKHESKHQQRLSRLKITKSSAILQEAQKNKRSTNPLRSNPARIQTLRISFNESNHTSKSKGANRFIRPDHEQKTQTGKEENLQIKATDRHMEIAIRVSLSLLPLRRISATREKDDASSKRILFIRRRRVHSGIYSLEVRDGILIVSAFFTEYVCAWIANFYKLFCLEKGQNNVM